jgi:cellulose synthase/poly-beta-1,6-N-acetylglucosamine synthase-like glycosyltransferase
MDGWKTVYTNRSECHEEVPEEWPVRVRQVKRWARGHNQVFFRHGRAFLGSHHLRARERLDGLMLMGVFLMPPLLLVGWCVALALYYLNASTLLLWFMPFFALMACGTLGNFAVLFEIVTAVLLDGNRRRVRLLPFNLPGFFVSMFSICSACLAAVRDRATGRGIIWSKTLRYRAPEASP